MKKVTIFTDGGARGNPGPAGAGAVILDEEGSVVAEVSHALGHQTNNWAEYEAVILGLQAAKKHFGKKIHQMHVEVKLDSELVARQLSNTYQIKEPSLFPQFIKAHNMLVKDFPNTVFTHIPREKNQEADHLANEAMDQVE